VKDIATVEISNMPRSGWVAKSARAKNKNGKDSITDERDIVEAIIVMRKGENPSEVVKAIEEKVAYLNQYILPADTKIVPYYDRSDLIDYATHTVMHNMIEGIIFLILLVTLFLFNWRTTL